MMAKTLLDVGNACEPGHEFLRDGSGQLCGQFGARLRCLRRQQEARLDKLE